MTNFVISKSFRYCFLFCLTYFLLLKQIYCVFSVFLIVFKSFLAILFLIENTKLRLVLIIATGVLITVADETMKTVPLAADIMHKVLSK